MAYNLLGCKQFKVKFPITTAEHLALAKFRYDSLQSADLIETQYFASIRALANIMGDATRKLDSALLFAFCRIVMSCTRFVLHTSMASFIMSK